MQPVTHLALEVTAAHAVITLEVPNDRLDGLAPLEHLSLLPADPLGLAPVHDVNMGVVPIHPPVAQVHKRCFWFDLAVLHQDRGLLQLLGQGVPVIGVAMECPRAHDQVAFERAGNAHLDPELIGLPGLALADMQATSGACQA